MNKDALTQAGLNLIGQALTIYDSDLRLAVCNQRFAEMFDLPTALTTPGAGFAETIRHLASRGEYGDVGEIETFVQARVDQARAFEPHYVERTRANGQTISVEGAPLPQGGWVAVYTDITQTKRQEALLRARSEVLSDQVLARSEELSQTNRELAATILALEEAQRELTEIEARTRLTTEMMPAHIAHIDSAGRYTYSNRRLSSVMPGRPSDILGLHLSDALGPETFARVLPHLQMAYSGVQSTFEFTDSESSRRIRSVFTPDENEKGIYVLSLDVTEETQARVALQQTRRREMAAQLTSGLTHDFSNLLTIILGMQSRLGKMDLPPEATTLIEATQGAARRGGDLLGRIADITSARSYRPEPVEMRGFLGDLETLAGPSLPDGIALAMHCGIDAALVTDPGMLQDSLLNLVLNARDACGTAGRITVTLAPVRDTWAEFTVADTGPGFSDQALQHGLDPFFTTKGEAGSGLGLSMVYDMAKLAGGEVRLGNGPQGAEVRLRLPLRRAGAPDPTGLVLLVEDSTDLRGTIRGMLTDMGHAVVEATSVDEAEALLADLPDVELVLSDLSLEGEATGVDLVRRAARARPDLPVRLMTALPPDAPLRLRAAALGPVLAKPFSAAQLAGHLSQSGASP